MTPKISMDVPFEWDSPDSERYDGILTPRLVRPGPDKKRRHATSVFPLRRCEGCNDVRAERQHRKTVMHILASVACFYPYKCRRCMTVGLVFVSSYRLIFPLLVVAGLSVIPHYYSAYRARVIDRLNQSNALYLAEADSADTVASRGAKATETSPYERMLVNRRKEVLRNEDIVMLAKSGADRALMIRLIMTSTGYYNLSTVGILALKQAGVPDPVIIAMLENSSVEP